MRIPIPDPGPRRIQPGVLQPIKLLSKFLHQLQLVRFSNLLPKPRLEINRTLQMGKVPDNGGVSFGKPIEWDEQRISLRLV